MKLTKLISQNLVKLFIGLNVFFLPVFGYGNNSTGSIPFEQSQYGVLNAFPETSAYVKNIGEKLVKASDYPDMPHEFIVLNTSIPNAWAYRGGKIAITRGLLLKIENESELAAILAHEVGHQVAYIRQQERESSPFTDTLSVSNKILTIFETASTLIYRKMMRQEEYDADFDGIRFMAKAGYNVEAAVKVQEVISKIGETSHQEIQTSWLESLEKTHPSSEARLAANIKTISHFPKNGITGEDSYLEVMKRLKDAEVAYQYLDQANVAFEQRQPEDALKLAKQALPLLENDASVHKVMADAYMAVRNEKEALSSLEKAISCDPDNASFHLNKGLILDRQGNKEDARKELETSLSLAPSSQAHFKLGLMDLREEDSQSAVLHLYAASKFNTPFGKMARAELAKIHFAI